MFLGTTAVPPWRQSELITTIRRVLNGRYFRSRLVESWILARLRNRTFFSLADHVRRMSASKAVRARYRSQELASAIPVLVPTTSSATLGLMLGIVVHPGEPSLNTFIGHWPHSPGRALGTKL